GSNRPRAATPSMAGGGGGGIIERHHERHHRPHHSPRPDLLNHHYRHYDQPGAQPAGGLSVRFSPPAERQPTRRTEASPTTGGVTGVEVQDRGEHGSVSMEGGERIPQGQEFSEAAAAAAAAAATTRSAGGGGSRDPWSAFLAAVDDDAVAAGGGAGTTPLDVSSDNFSSTDEYERFDTAPGSFGGAGERSRIRRQLNRRRSGRGGGNATALSSGASGFAGGSSNSDGDEYFGSDEDSDALYSTAHGDVMEALYYTAGASILPGIGLIAEWQQQQEPFTAAPALTGPTDSHGLDAGVTGAADTDAEAAATAAAATATASAEPATSPLGGFLAVSGGGGEGGTAVDVSVGPAVSAAPAQQLVLLSPPPSTPLPPPPSSSSPPSKAATAACQAPAHGSFQSPFAPLSQRQLTPRAASLESQLLLLLAPADTPSPAPAGPDAGANVPATVLAAGRPAAQLQPRTMLLSQPTRGASDGLVRLLTPTDLGDAGDVGLGAAVVFSKLPSHTEGGLSGASTQKPLHLLSPLPSPQSHLQQPPPQRPPQAIEQQEAPPEGRPRGQVTDGRQETPPVPERPEELLKETGLRQGGAEAAAGGVPSRARGGPNTRTLGPAAALCTARLQPLSRRSSSGLLGSASGAVVHRLGSQALLAAAPGLTRLGSTGVGTSAGTEAAELENSSRLVAYRAISGPALMSEYLAGNSIRSALRRHSDVVKSPLARIKVALDAAQGMEYLHSRGVAHLNLKTGNLLVGFSEKQPACKVCDFGLRRSTLLAAVGRTETSAPASGTATTRSQASQLPQPLHAHASSPQQPQQHHPVQQQLQQQQAPMALLARSLPWTAPEVLRTPYEVTEKADVYSYGMIMWSLWTRAEPWASANTLALLAAVLAGEEPRPPVPGDPDWPASEPRPPELAPGWANLMRRCWAADPWDRPAFSEVLERMRAMFQQVKTQRRAARAAAATSSRDAGNNKP
ncbi:hypothetical protein Vretimale_6155, partial [Volvox reticuliferus]